MRFRSVLVALLLLAVAASSEARWVSVGSSVANQSPAIEVSRAGAGAWHVQVTVPGVERTTVMQNGVTLDQLELPGEASLGESGEAEIPAISRVVGLGYSGNPTIEVTGEEWEELPGTYDLTSVADGPEVPSRLGAYWSRDEYLPSEKYAVSGREVLGGFPMAALQIHAVQYNPVQRKVRVLKNADLRVIETGSPSRMNRPITETTASLLRNVVSNWRDMSLDDIPGDIVRGTLLYIVCNDTDVRTGLQELIKWRQRKGYSVEVAGPALIGTMSSANIKTYIQTRYNNANPPLEFVCLVGDGAASDGYYIPTYGYSLSDGGGSGYGVGDVDYAFLDGTDLLPDVALSRICFTSVLDMMKQVNKTLRYERTPASLTDGLAGSNPNWYKSGGCFAGEAISGVSTIQTMRTIHQRMLDAGFNSSSIDTVYFSHQTVSPSDINASINSGVSLWCYRGWIGMSGYSTSDVNALTSVGHWPFIMNLTCSTNDFADGSYDQCETFMVGGTNSTPGSPTGAIAIFGMSSSHTQVHFNNTLMAGAVQGLLTEGVRSPGGCLSRAKLEMWRNYHLSANDSSDGRILFFDGITNCLGDPATDIFTDTPDTLYVNNPVSVSVGANTMTLTVSDVHGQNIQGAYVNLLKGTEVFVGGFTGTNGQITFNFNTTNADTLWVTASKHNARPAINYTVVTTSAQYVAPASAVFTLNDDATPPSSGNGDGLVNPSETIELALPLKNWGTSSASGVQAVLSIASPYATVTTSTETYGTIGAGATVSPPAPFVFSLASYAPDGFILQFTLTVTDAALHTWISSVPIRVANGHFALISDSVANAGNGILDPGETGQLILTLNNAGRRTIPAGTLGYLRSLNHSVTVTDSVGTFTAAMANANSNNSADRFGVTASANAFPGEHIQFTLTFPMASGFADTVNFSLTVGSVASNSPTPPDAYGYWAFDNTDTSYAKHPTFNWVEIDPRYGGSGTILPLVDASNEADASVTASLPFSFNFYGQAFNQITVCSNGWLAMGDQSDQTDFRNYNLPCANGPSAMIAPFWDDLWVTGVGGLLRTPPERTAEDQALAKWKSEVSRAGNDERRSDQNLDQGNDACPATVISSLPYSDTGTTTGQTHNYDVSCFSSTAPDVIYQYTPSSSITCDVALCGSSYDTGLLVKTGGSCPGTTEVGCNDDDATHCGGNQSYLQVSMTGGTTYYIIVTGWSTSSGSYTLSMTEQQQPQDCASATVIPSLPFSVDGSTAGASNVCGNAAPDAFYKYTVQSPGETLQVDLCGSLYDTYLRLWRPCCVTQLAGDDDACGSLTSKIGPLYVTAGDLWIQVEGYQSNAGNYSLHVTRYIPPVAGAVYTYNDATNHRFIVEWSHVEKYTGSGTNPMETFECILQQAGYPATPTGDGEILFQYGSILNTADAGYYSNAYATAGIMNLNKTDGVTYSVYNRVSPIIPGGAGLVDGRAILFTTQKMPPTTPKSPVGVVAFRSGNDVKVVWNPVTRDINENPIAVAGYKVYGSTTPTFVTDGTTLVATTTDTTYLRVGAPDTKFFFTVQCYTADGLVSPLSPESVPDAMQTKGAPPMKTRVSTDR